MADVQTFQHGSDYFLFDTEFFEQIGRHHFQPEFWQTQNAITGQERGRGTTWFVRHRDKELVLRHYLRGGFVARFNKDYYWFRDWQHCRSINEFTTLHAAHALGLPVPRPVAAYARRIGLLYQADILLERIPHARDLIRVLQQAQDKNFYHRLGQCLAQLHQARIYHPDLNIKNIMVDVEGKFWLIDFDQARIQSGEFTQETEVLARLKRSFMKEVGRHGIQWQEESWKEMMAGYGAIKSHHRQH